MYESFAVKHKQLLQNIRHSDHHHGDSDYPEFITFVREIGFGSIGPGYLAVSPRLRDFPSDWHLQDEALRSGIKLFAEDLVGSSFGYHIRYGTKIIRYCSDDGSVIVCADTFIEWLENELRE